MCSKIFTSAEKDFSLMLQPIGRNTMMVTKEHLIFSIQNHGLKIEFGDYDCVHYKKDVEQDGNLFEMYYWAMGKGNHLFICSFTIDKKQEKEKGNAAVLKTVTDIIKSIELT